MAGEALWWWGERMGSGCGIQEVDVDESFLTITQSGGEAPGLNCALERRVSEQSRAYSLTKGNWSTRQYLVGSYSV